MTGRAFICLAYFDLFPGGGRIDCLSTQSGDEVWEDHRDQMTLYLGIRLSILKQVWGSGGEGSCSVGGGSRVHFLGGCCRSGGVRKLGA